MLYPLSYERRFCCPDVRFLFRTRILPSPHKVAELMIPENLGSSHGSEHIVHHPRRCPLEAMLGPALTRTSVPAVLRRQVPGGAKSPAVIPAMTAGAEPRLAV
jgi:hypothetical protein